MVPNNCVAKPDAFQLIKECLADDCQRENIPFGEQGKDVKEQNVDAQLGETHAFDFPFAAR